MNSIQCSENEFQDSVELLEGNDSALTHVGWIMPQEGDFGFHRTHRCAFTVTGVGPGKLLGYVEE